MNFLKGQGENDATVSLTPLVDIIFLLIIFFLVSSTFEKGEQRLGIQLPATKGKAEKDAPKPESWTILVDEKGKYFWDEKPLSLGDLESRLLRNRARHEKVQVIVKADGRVEWARVSSVLGLLSEYDYKKVSFKTIELAE